MTTKPQGAWMFSRACRQPEHELQQLELVDVVIVTIPNKLANQMVRMLASTLPVEDLKHLRRIRKCMAAAAAPDRLDLLLCKWPGSRKSFAASMSEGGLVSNAMQPADGDVDACMPQQPAQASLSNEADGKMYVDADGLPPAAAKLVLEHGLQPFVMAVPAHPPQTKEQWKEWGEYWPVSWKIPEKQPLTGDALLATDEDQLYFEQQMDSALRLAREHGVQNAVILVDPVTREIIAQGVDGTEQHPLDHAAMVAIRAAAARDMLLWPQACQTPAAADVGREQQQQDQQPGAHLQQAAEDGPSCPCKRQCVGEQGAQAARPPCIGAGAAASSPSSCGQDGCQAQAYTGDAPQTSAFSLLHQRKPGPKPYMCTGYDCFVVAEPCVMCAMALVHSRLARVVYSQTDREHGALGGKQNIMAQRSLNHHYEVYKLPSLQPSGEQ